MFWTPYVSQLILMSENGDRARSHTMVQLGTPNEMRGRVSAVNMVFIGASNEVGQFESGLTAQWLGTVPAVIAGGLGTILVVGLWAWFFPALRRVDELVPAKVSSTT